MAYTGDVRFEWDPSKDRANQLKHGLSFDEAAALFTSDDEHLEIYDQEHSEDEDRFIAIGVVRGVVVVVFIEAPDDVIRIVSARKATKKEMEIFYEYLGGING